MSDFPVNDGREEIEETAVQQSESFADDEFSTVFADPIEHKIKATDKKKKKRVLSVVAAILAVAVLIGGTVAVVKLIPEKETDEDDIYNDNSISVLKMDVDKINSVTVKNSVSTFKLIATRTETEAEDGDTEDSEDTSTVETVWSVEGTDAKFTSSASIASVVDTAATLSAVGEITGRTTAECGLDAPVIVLNIDSEEGNKTVNFGGKSADGLGYYVQLTGEDKIYLVDYSLAENFEFELYDFADTSGITGISTDDVNVDYVSDETIITFDSITLSGKNFPSPMVVEPTDDTSDISQYFRYVITSPKKRVADKVDTVLNLFTSGLSVSGAYAFDVSAQSLKSVGLDAPYLTATIVLGDYSRTYKISKVDDEYCAVVTNDSYMIHKVAASNIEILESDIESFYSNMAYLKSITELSNLTLTSGEESYSFGIKYDEEAEDEQFEITYNGEKITAEFFQNFYQHFVGVTFTDFKEECDISNIELTVTLTFLDGHKETVAFAKDSATKYACVVNGECLGRVSSNDYMRLLKDIRNVAQNKDIP